MKLSNEFTVNAPIDKTWEVLTDVERIAPCMPGAQLTGVDGDVYSGKVKIKVGPVVATYTGTITFAEKDQATHHAVIKAKGKDARGGGNASATITAQLRESAGRTTVTVDTDLTITGKIAQFGSGMIQEISEKLLSQFTASLEEEILPKPVEPAGEPADSADSADSGRSGQATAPSVGSASRTAPDAPPVDMLALAGDSVTKRVAPIAVVLAVLAAIIVIVRGRSSS